MWFNVMSRTIFFSQNSIFFSSANEEALLKYLKIAGLDYFWSLY